VNKLSDHLFVSSTDGHLYDTRKPEWHKQLPLRKDYCRTFETIRNSRELRATIRNGGYAWPGGYPLVFLTADGDCISFNAAEKQYWQCANDMRNFPSQRIVGCFIHWEGSPIECALSGEQIKSAYGETEETENAE
jgi:hypothetical protein